MNLRVTISSPEKRREVGMDRLRRRSFLEMSTLSQKCEQTSSIPMRDVWRESHGAAERPPFEIQKSVAGKSAGFFRANQT